MFAITSGRAHQSTLSSGIPLPSWSSLPLASLLVIVVSVQRVLQLGRDLLEEADLLAEVMLHLRAEVPYTCAVEVLDLSQRGAGNDVAAVVEFTFLLRTVFHLGERTWKRTGEGGGSKRRTGLRKWI